MSDPDPSDWIPLLARLERLAAKAEAFLPGPATLPDPAPALAYRWRGGGRLAPVDHPQPMALDDLIGIEHQRDALLRNTAAFVRGRPANHALLWGARGTGKSSLVKGVLHRFAADGLRLVEVEAHELKHLPEIVAPLHGHSQRFLIFADDLSFAEDDPDYKALKAILEGSIAAPPPNVLVYATSNRRHLMPERFADNAEARAIDGEIHPGETVDEKVSLSDRFGLWLSFYPFDQETYLTIVEHWLARLGGGVGGGADGGGGMDADIRRAALAFSRLRASKSGRTARQFVVDWVGNR